MGLKCLFLVFTTHQTTSEPQVEEYLKWENERVKTLSTWEQWTKTLGGQGKSQDAIVKWKQEWKCITNKDRNSGHWCRRKYTPAFTGFVI